jgi:hypothetical protein
LDDAGLRVAARTVRQSAMFSVAYKNCLNNSHNFYLKYFSISITLNIIQKLCIYLCSVIGARFITWATKLKIMSQRPRCVCLISLEQWGRILCVWVATVLCMQRACRAHVSKRQEIELSWEILKQRAGRADEWSLGAFAKLRKVTIGFVISARTSVRIEQLGSHWSDFHENLIFEDFSKIRRENSSFIKSWQE